MWEICAYFFRVCLEGKWPTTDYFGNEWPESSCRAILAGQPLFQYNGNDYHGVLVEVSCDLDEYSKTLGLPNYRSSYGCVQCFRPKTDLSHFKPPSRKRPHQWFWDSAESSLKYYKVDDGQVQELLANIKGKKEHGGLMITEPLNHLFPGICRNDRIEPTVFGCPDIVHGDKCTDYAPEKRKFLAYRRAKNLLLFYNRLIHIPGVCEGIPHLKTEMFLFDSMHTLELGCLQNYLGCVIWRLLEQNFFGYAGNIKKETDHLDAALTDSIQCWYAQRGVRVT